MGPETLDQKAQNDVKHEYYQKYMALQQELDGCEKTVGQWNPLNKFQNVYNMMDQLQEQIEDFNSQPEDQKSVPSTGGGDSLSVSAATNTRHVNSISNKAKEFKKSLTPLSKNKK